MAAPILLPAEYRYAGDDWVGADAFVFTAWVTPPVFSPSGTLTTPGVALDISGYSADGGVYDRHILERASNSADARAPFALSGAIADPTHGKFELTLSRVSTALLKIQPATAAAPNYILRSRLIDPQGHIITVASIPLFVL